jgi:hypothetical protein
VPQEHWSLLEERSSVLPFAAQRGDVSQMADVSQIENVSQIKDMNRMGDVSQAENLCEKGIFGSAKVGLYKIF